MEYKWYELDINPEPWAVGPLGVIRRGGKMIPTMGRNLQLHNYKEAVKEALLAPITQPEEIIGPVSMVIYFWRQRAEYETPQARSHRKHEADTTNLQKATEDACQGILYKNDKDVKDIHSVMVDQGPEVHGKVLIGVAAWDRNTLPDWIRQDWNDNSQV